MLHHNIHEVAGIGSQKERQRAEGLHEMFCDTLDGRIEECEPPCNGTLESGSNMRRAGTPSTILCMCI